MGFYAVLAVLVIPALPDNLVWPNDVNTYGTESLLVMNEILYSDHLESSVIM